MAASEALTFPHFSLVVGYCQPSLTIPILISDVFIVISPLGPSTAKSIVDVLRNPEKIVGPSTLDKPNLQHCGPRVILRACNSA